MMEPVFFPHTFVGGDLARLMAVVFGKTTLFLPTDLDLPPVVLKQEAKGRVRLVQAQAQGLDKATLAAFLADAGQWGQSHQGADPGAWKTGETPLYEDLAPTRLREEIDQTRKPPAGPAPENDNIARAAFLLLAQQADANAWETVRRLAEVGQKESAMHDLLSGESKESGKAVPVALPQTWDHMPRRRVNAWAGLFSSLADQHRLFVTTSAPALDALLEKQPGLSLVKGGIPLAWGPDRGDWAARLGECLDALHRADDSRAGCLEALSQNAPENAPAFLDIYQCACGRPFGFDSPDGLNGEILDSPAKTEDCAIVCFLRLQA